MTMNSFVVCVLISLFAVSSVYYYFYVKEHEIASFRQNGFLITSKCRGVETFTFAPYVSVYFKSTEILTAKINPGYDTISDCVRSSIKEVTLAPDRKQIQVEMRNGEVRDINIADSSSYLEVTDQ